MYGKELRCLNTKGKYGKVTNTEIKWSIISKSVMIIIFVEFIDQLIDFPINRASLTNNVSRFTICLARGTNTIYLHSLPPTDRPCSFRRGTLYTKTYAVLMFFCEGKNPIKGMKEWLHFFNILSIHAVWPKMSKNENNKWQIRHNKTKVNVNLNFIKILSISTTYLEESSDLLWLGYSSSILLDLGILSMQKYVRLQTTFDNVLLNVKGHWLVVKSSHFYTKPML